MARARAVMEKTTTERRRTAARAEPKRGTRAGRPSAAPARRRERLFHQTVRSFDLWSVLKVSVCFYLLGLIITLAALSVLWWIGSTVGVIDNIEDFVADLLGYRDLDFLSWPILRGTTLVGLVLVCLLVVVTVLAAAVYNLFAEIVGGIEITVSEEDPY